MPTGSRPLALAVLVWAGGAHAAPAQGAPAGGRPPRDDGRWTMPGKHYAATRSSALAQITPANAARLEPVWTFSTGVLRGHEGQPLVVKNTMYRSEEHTSELQ